MDDIAVDGIGAAEPAPVKRGMSDEHKAKMAEGRARAAASRSRGRPAMRETSAPLPPVMPSGMTEEQRILEDLNRQIAAVESGQVEVSRERVGDGGFNFDIPIQGRRHGWDYEYKTYKVAAEEVDPSDLQQYTLGGWIPVPRTDMPTEMPPGSHSPYIERRGQRMYMRPQRLTDQAKQEQIEHAYRVKEEKLQGAMAGESGRDMAARRLPDGRPAASISIERQPLL